MILKYLDTMIAFTVVMLGISLLITVLTQMVTNLLGLRGTELKRGLVNLLKTVHPDLATHATAIAQRVLEHPLVSDSVFAKFAPGNVPVLRRWRLASAVRLDELIGTMEKLSAGTPAAAVGAPVNTWTTEQAMAAIAAATLATPGREVQAVSAQIRGVAGAVAGALPNNVSMQIDKLTERIPTAAEVRLQGLKSWFDGAMDRAAQRFTLKARLVTVILSIVFVFAAHLDAVELLDRLSRDAELRAKLVGLSDTMQQQAKTILDQPGSGTAPAMRPSGGSATPAERSKDAEALKTAAETIKRDLGQTGLRLIPDSFQLKFKSEEVPGILVAAALLSLGAPFWFNALKNLANLRPVLATKQQAEQRPEAE